eukprot:806167_1
MAQKQEEVRLFSKDPIHNLQIQISIKRVDHLVSTTAKSNTLKAMQVNAIRQSMTAEKAASTIDDKTDDAPAAKPAPPSSGQILSMNMKWQQKVFSAREVFTYARKRRPTRTPLDRMYSEDVKKLLECEHDGEELEAAGRQFVIQKSGMMLCTKVNDDCFIEPGERREEVTTSREKDLNPVAAKQLRSSEHQKHTNASDATNESMFLLAAVGLPGKDEKLQSSAKLTSVGEEIVLCRIRAYKNGSFEIKPNFNGSPESGQPYQFTTPSGTAFQFWLENISSDEGREGRAKEMKFEQQRMARLRDLRKNLFYSQFEQPPPLGKFRVTNFAEIVRAVDFDADDIYVQYELHIPDGWQWSPADTDRRRAAVSQVSRAMRVHRSQIHQSNSASAGQTHHQQQEEESDSDSDYEWDGGPLRQWVKVVNFGFPLEYELQANEDALLKPPTIYLQVNSFDSWHRHRAEGYGFIHLPIESGSHSLTVHMWRPIGSRLDEMRRFFVGGAPMLQS